VGLKTIAVAAAMLATTGISVGEPGFAPPARTGLQVALIPAQAGIQHIQKGESLLYSPQAVGQVERENRAEHSFPRKRESSEHVLNDAFWNPSSLGLSANSLLTALSDGMLRWTERSPSSDRAYRRDRILLPDAAGDAVEESDQSAKTTFLQRWGIPLAATAAVGGAIYTIYTVRGR